MDEPVVCSGCKERDVRIAELERELQALKQRRSELEIAPEDQFLELLDSALRKSIGCGKAGQEKEIEA